MKKFIQTIRDIWTIEELRNKILLTLGFMAIYRFAAQVPLPGIDITVAQAALANQTSGGGILGLLDMFTGGAFAQASIVALGIMPYISASIVVQLMGIAVPYLQKLQKDGESGRKKINQITRWLTIAITMVQGPAYITNIYQLIPSSAFYISGSMFWITSMVILTSGTVFAMWLGEKITDKGIGNGISLLIMIGIIARFPESFMQEAVSKLTASNGGAIMILIELIIWFLVIMVCVYLVTAVRRIAVQYARKTVAGNIKNVTGARDYLPLKLNSSGVMPIIFAQAIMFAPALLERSNNDTVKAIGIEFSNMFGLWYNVLFATLIIIFSYFYTAITIPTNKMADDLKRSGGFIPGIRPGKDTAEMLDRVLSLITFPGSLFLALVAILPAIVVKFGLTQSWALFYGGTSLLIMVGVAIDTIQQINSHLLNRHYDGLMKKGTKRKSVT
ncbi:MULTISPECIES: preprotein translocase subunit SecY [Flavobacteriaceae]|uniref:Protein translocase subunit SecY n=2 Tax=Flavobacteriaceae TaxID=49546 RepID=A0A4Y8AS98_9FLAO|nr:MULTISPECIES: preprotein translocase subunit SecY [Flavobacteriaceae]TEW73116.1 preprotein translocase subunit SecY [Gramella jeungdoensis]GGK46890.1 protein translocase subunit SecY [Lutibacter litoralis]